jgi:sugar/nucleoside kinase (ribokinase family)
VTRRRTRVAVIGDATLDITVLDAAPRPGRDHPAQIHAGSGGQGANVAVRLARRDVEVSLVTALGTDPAGQVVSRALAEEGVRIVNAAADSARTGTVIALVDGVGERAMLSDRVPLDPVGLTRPAVHAALDGADWIHLSGYPLADPESGAALADLAASRRDKQRCSIGGGSFAAGAEVSARMRVARPDLVVVDRAEADTILDASPATPDRTTQALAVELAAALRSIAIVTAGAAGAALAAGDGVLVVEGRPRSVVDATGAGDALTASLIATLGRESWPPPLAVLRRALEEAAEFGADVAGAVGAQTHLVTEAQR